MLSIYFGRRSGQHRTDALGAEPRWNEPADRRHSRTGSSAMSRAAAADRRARVGRRQAHRARLGDRLRSSDDTQTGQSAPAVIVTIVRTGASRGTPGDAKMRHRNPRGGQNADFFLGGGKI